MNDQSASQISPPDDRQINAAYNVQNQDSNSNDTNETVTHSEIDLTIPTNSENEIAENDSERNTSVPNRSLNQNIAEDGNSISEDVAQTPDEFEPPRTGSAGENQSQCKNVSSDKHTSSSSKMKEDLIVIKNAAKEKAQKIVKKVDIKLQDHIPPGNNIKITFHVLIHNSLLSHEEKVYIVFDIPIGNGKTAMVLMEPVEKFCSNDQYVYLTGFYHLELSFQNRILPYNYIVMRNWSKPREKFSQTTTSLKLSRYLMFQQNHHPEFDQYDDCIAIDKNDTIKAHNEGRANSFLTMALNAFDYQKYDENSFVHKIWEMYQSQFTQKLVDQEHNLHKFGNNYVVDNSGSDLLQFISPSLQKSPVGYISVTMALTIAYADFHLGEDHKVHNHFEFTTFVKKLFSTYSHLMTVCNTVEEFLSFINISEEYEKKFLGSLIKLINKYISLVNLWKISPGYPAVFALSLFRIFKWSAAKLVTEIKIDMLRSILSAGRIETSTQNDFTEILTEIKKLPKQNTFLKNEYVELCSSDIFVNFLSSEEDLMYFPLKTVFNRFCEEVVKRTTEENNSFAAKIKSWLLIQYNLMSSNQTVTIEDAEMMLQSLSKCIHVTNHDILSFFISFLFNLPKICNSPEVHLKNKITPLLQTITDQVIKLISSSSKSQNQIPFVQIAQIWSKYITLVEQSGDKMILNKFLTSLKDEVSSWNLKTHESDIMSNFTKFNPTVLQMIFESLFSEGIRQENMTFYISTLLQISPNEDKKNKGLLLSWLIVCFSQLNETNEKNALCLFMLVTDSDNFCKIYKQVDEYQKHMTKVASVRLTSILDNLTEFKNLLEDGKLTFAVMENLKCPDRMARLIQIFELSGKDINELIRVRLEEFDHVNDKLNYIQEYISFIKIEIKTELSFDTFISVDKETETLLKYYCDIRNIDSTEQPKCKLCGDEKKEQMIQFSEHLKSFCFQKFIKASISSDEFEDWNAVDALSWTKTKIDEFSEFGIRLANDEMILSDVKDFFSECSSDISVIEQELEIIQSLVKIDPNWISAIGKKIQLLLSVNEFSDKANALLETANVLGVNCNESSKTAITEISKNFESFLDKRLNDLSPEMLKCHEKLSSWTPEQFSAVNMLNQCGNLVKWIRENIESLTELNVFVEIASIAAGESDKDVDRVHHFKSAVRAYAGFLFDCKKDCSLNNLLEACAILFKDLERYPEIVEKLKDSNSHFRWFEFVKNQQGSVEMSSLNLVKLIVDSGELFINKSQMQPSLVDVKMKYKEVIDNESNDERSLSLSELKELESKLMLISIDAEMKPLIQRFITVLHKVILITKHLEQLYSCGCWLFYEFSVICHFSTDKRVTLLLDFGGKSGILKGRGKLEDELSAVLKYLERCAFKWNDFIMNLRANTHFLNYFSTDQLVNLSESIARFEKGEVDKREQLLQLLSLISTNINLEVLEKSIHSVPIDAIVDEDSSSVEDIEPNPELDEIRRIVGHISEQYGCEEENILACIKQTGNRTNDDEIVNWCYENEDKRATYEDFMINDHGRSNLATNYVLDPNTEEENTDQLPKSEIYGEVTEIFDGFMNSTNTTDSDHFITFKRLNGILHYCNSEISHPLKRVFPSYLQVGRPNLIIVKERQILQTALILYQTDEGKDLPSLDEVLICQKETTLEQLHLLCLRAFNDSSGKIYTILHAERINFDNGCEIEKLISKPVSNKYRLIFLCCEESAKQAYMTSAFQKYRVNVPEMLYDKQSISQFIHRHLQTNDTESIGFQADPEKLRFRIISSTRYGEGKSLVSKKMEDRSKFQRSTFTIYSENLDMFDLVKSLIKRSSITHIYHFDLQSSVREGVQELLFSLMVLSGVRDKDGNIWKYRPTDYCIVEKIVSQDSEESFESLLPVIWCCSPSESREYYQSQLHEEQLTFHETDKGFFHYLDYETILSDDCQRPCQYLDCLAKKKSVDNFSFSQSNMSAIKCLQILLDSCCIDNPSWVELCNFWIFLNDQLKNCERSVYCNPQLVGNTLPGFKTFAVKFLIDMTQDMSTRSAVITDKSIPVPQIQDRNKWENRPHPYLFFNEDGQTFCFFGFRIQNCHLVDEHNQNSIIRQNVITKDLFKKLSLQGIENRGKEGKEQGKSNSFDRKLNEFLPSELRELYLENLRRVFGLKSVSDVDKNYELTSDNVLKMLAIQMRFRAGIPVVIIGETGVGKTRLIRFMCDLQKQGRDEKNLVIVKCHGGIQKETIYNNVRKTIVLAQRNFEIGIKQTVLFFDEANTTDAIGAIKEVMCDKQFDGQPIPDDMGIKFVAAVNPYREHTPEMIEKLESAGLGYHMKPESVRDKLAGRIPMRRLVYRVNQIPPSMVPLIWDFGTLDDATEEKYIRQIVADRIETENWPTDKHEFLVSVLSRCQQVMRTMSDECSFVSLRDVNRCLDILSWFHKKGSLIVDPIKHDLQKEHSPQNDFTIQIILSIACTYYVRLENRTRFFSELEICCDSIILEIINSCQNLFISELKLKPTICKNEALKENLWIMVICIELKIPLFLVGRPGSSKSLAKTLVTNIMQGEKSQSSFFKNFKEIQVSSFQCSPMVTADGILSTFRQCQIYQKKNDLTVYSAVVVLDEIGLAEDSPQMPLKSLHPLLENGCIDDEEPEMYKQVAFIGLSNWALDPAKMNRGIFISRGTLSQKNLVETARGICLNDPEMRRHLEVYLEDIVDAYIALYISQKKEFHGLRDFYSLIKMLFQIYYTGGGITPKCVKYAIYRCFGGCSDEMKSARQFINHMKSIPRQLQQESDLSQFDLVKDALMKNPNSISLSSNQKNSNSSSDIETALTENQENRYLLLLTENNAALQILMDRRLNLISQKVCVIFGSSFSHDQEYMQLCKNINRIKIAMEVGQTVILCNLPNLYESLYDALNQSYVYMGGTRYVDLGLGLHRVKCRVHKSFRLIVVAEAVDVWEKFPIPLISRFEKHVLKMDTLIKGDLKRDIESLNAWIQSFIRIECPNFVQPCREDVFIGFHTDAPSSLLIQSKGKKNLKPPLEFAKDKLIQCATPDSIIRLKSSSLCKSDVETACESYFSKQELKSLVDAIKTMKCKRKVFLQITTHGRMLTFASRGRVAEALGISKCQIQLISLHQIDSEEQLSHKLEDFLKNCKEEQSENILILQYSLNSVIDFASIIEYVRYFVKSVSDNYRNNSYQIVLLIQTPRGRKFLGFASTPWMCLHIDEIHSENASLDLLSLNGKSTGEIFEILQEDVFFNLFAELSPSFCCKLEPSDYTRTMEKISIISSIRLDDNFTAKLMQTVRRRVIQYEFQQSKAHNLLLDLSLHSIYLLEGHTFQETVRLTLQDEILPHFIKSLQFCDIGHGLNHLQSDAPWITDFYLTYFDKLEVFLPGFNDLPANFKSCFPFSWAIFYLIENFHSHEPTIHAGTLLDALKGTHLGSSVVEVFNTHNVESANLFARDMIAMKYPILVEDPKLENILVKQVVQIATQEISPHRVKDMSEKGLPTELTVMSTDLYLSLMKIDNHFGILSDSISFSKFNLSKSIKTELTEKSFEKNESIDWRALTIILAALDPSKLDLFTKEARTHWTKNIKKCQIILKKYFFLHKGQDNSLFESFRKLEILSLFAEYVITENLTAKFQRKLVQSLKTLSVRLNNCSDLKRELTFDKLLKWLCKSSHESARLIFYGGVEKCFICDENLQQDPVALPCDHVACLKCLQKVKGLIKESKWTCPHTECKRVYDEDFKLESTLQCNEAVEEHQIFRQSVRIFFQEILQRFVFQENILPDEAVIKTLLNFSVSEELTKEEEVARTLTPFSKELYIDSTRPTIISLIFSLMLKCCGNDPIGSERIFALFDSVIDYSKNQSEICLLLLYCLEDSLLTRQKYRSFKTMTEIESASFINQTVESLLSAKSTQTSFFQKLELTAHIRIYLSSAAKLLHCLISKQESLPEDYEIILKRTGELMISISKNSLFTYLVKELSSKYSTATILDWKKSGLYLDLMIETLRISDIDFHPDYFCVIDREYAETRNRIFYQVRKSLDSKSFELPENSKRIICNLALFYIMSAVVSQKDSEEIIDLMISQMTAVIANEKQSEIFKKLTEMMRTTQSASEKAIICLIFHFHEMLLSLESRENGVIKFFYQLCFSSNELERTYFPTMPQDDLSDVLPIMHRPDEYQLDDNYFRSLYRCPNGHPFGVGNCGQLDEVSTCPDCKVRIGGSDSILVNEFKDKTKTGYILELPTSTQMTIGVRELSGLQVCAIRFLMHASMFLCVKKSDLTALIEPRISTNDLDPFLMKHLKHDICELSRSLARSEDQAYIFLHMMIVNLLHCDNQESLDLQTKQEREIWERKFCAVIPDDELLNQTYSNFQNRNKLPEQNHILFSCLQKEDVSDFLIDNLPFVAPLWEPRIRICLDNIFQKIKPDKLESQSPLFSLVLRNQTELLLTKHLVSIIKLQKSLVQRFNRDLDLADLENITIEDFLQKHFSDFDEKIYFEEWIKLYLNLFNQLCDKIFNHNQAGRLAMEHFKSCNLSCDEARMNKTPCGILFPSKFGFGLCGVALVEFLIDSHNHVLRRYMENHPDHQDLPTVDPCTIDSSQLIGFERDELETLLIVNSQYSLQDGGATEWSIDLKNLERQVEHRFFFGQVLIDKKNIPLLQFPDGDKSLTKRSLIIPQCPLPARIKSEIKSNLNLPDLCLLLNYCQSTRNLLALILQTNLANTSVTKDTSLNIYAKMVHLKIAPQIEKSGVMDKISLEYIDGLIVFLKVERAKRIILKKQNPWQGLLKRELQTPIDSNLNESLNEVLRQIPADDLLSRLYRFIEEYIVSGLIEDGDYSIVECIYEFLFENDDDYSDKFQAIFPKEALIKHVTACFAYFVNKIEKDSTVKQDLF